MINGGIFIYVFAQIMKVRDNNMKNDNKEFCCVSVYIWRYINLSLMIFFTEISKNFNNAINMTFTYNL